MQEESSNSTTYNDLMKKIEAMRKNPKKKQKKKLPTLLLFFNVALIALIAFHFYRTAPERHYYTTMLRYGEIRYRFSITHDEATRKVSYSVSVKNESTGDRAVDYRGPLATVSLYHADTDVGSVPIAENVKKLSLQPNEVKVFFNTMDDTHLKDFASAHPELFVPKRRTFFSPARRHVPLTAEIRVNTTPVVATILEFKYTEER